MTSTLQFCQAKKLQPEKMTHDDEKHWENAK